MKKLTCLLTMACCFMLQGTSSASLIVTIGNVYGTNTFLDVRVEGSGTLTDSLHYFSSLALPQGSPPVSPAVSNVNGFAKSVENNIGEVYTGTQYNHWGQLLSTPITLHNTTDSTTEQIEYLLFDYDTGTGTDDFTLLFIAPAGFLVSGESWTISGYSTFTLGKGNSTYFHLGTYSYVDPSVGEVTLIVQEEPALVPEPSTVLSLIVGVVLLMGIGRRKTR